MGFTVESILTDSKLPEFDSEESDEVLFFRIFSAVFPSFVDDVKSPPLKMDLQALPRLAEVLGPPMNGVLHVLHRFLTKEMDQREFSYRNVVDLLGMLFSPVEDLQGVKSFASLKHTKEDDVRSYVFLLLPEAVERAAQSTAATIEKFVDEFVASFLVSAKSAVNTQTLRGQFPLCAEMSLNFANRRSILLRFREFAVSTLAPPSAAPSTRVEASSVGSVENSSVFKSVDSIPPTTAIQYRAKAIALKDEWIRKNLRPQPKLMPSDDLLTLVYSHTLSQSCLSGVWTLCRGRFPFVELSKCTGANSPKTLQTNREKNLEGTVELNSTFVPQQGQAILKFKDSTTQKMYVDNLLPCLDKLGFAYQMVGALNGPAESQIFTEYRHRVAAYYEEYAPFRPYIVDLCQRVQEQWDIYTSQGLCLSASIAKTIQKNGDMDELLETVVKPHVSDAFNKLLSSGNAGSKPKGGKGGGEALPSDQGKGSGADESRKRQAPANRSVQLKFGFCFPFHFKGQCTRPSSGDNKCRFLASHSSCPLKLPNGEICGQPHSFAEAHPEEAKRYETESAAKRARRSER